MFTREFHSFMKICSPGFLLIFGIVIGHSMQGPTYYFYGFIPEISVYAAVMALVLIFPDIRIYYENSKEDTEYFERWGDFK